MDFTAIARAAAGASGAELANIVNEAALRAVRQGRSSVIAGRPGGERGGGHRRLPEARTQMLSDKEKRIVAYHEMGHALVAALQSNSAPVHEDHHRPAHLRRAGLHHAGGRGRARCCMTKRGAATTRSPRSPAAARRRNWCSAPITTGASNDIEQATKLARAMLDAVRHEREVRHGGPGDARATSTWAGTRPSPARRRPRRRSTAEVVELRAHGSTKRRSALLQRKHAAACIELAKFLYEKETITGEEFMEILNQPVPKLQAPEA